MHPQTLPGAAGMNPGVSVIICCHNSAKRLPETLRHLAAQQVRQDIPWEVVVIDNASTDGTADTARRCWPETSPAPLRVVAEPRPGVGNARFRSFSEAHFAIISFVDDDNWVGPDWIANVARFFQQHPEASAVGGPSRAAFEITPPKWFAGISGYYAIGDQHAFAGDITDQPGTLLWTAGMSLRRNKVLDLVDQGFRFLACGGPSLPLKTGEDTELCFALRASGSRLYYDPALVIEHFMPADRLTWPKALRLMRTMGNSSVLFDLYLIALNVSYVRTRRVWKKTWLFQALKALRSLLRLLLFHPVDCLWWPEGSRYALEYEKTVGQLATLRILCGRYKKLGEGIRRSAWVNG
jgi:glycosyltransferase involved in cell wall biosynthesis